MHCLIYYSSSTYLFSSEDLRDILVKSRINNASLDITGLLLYHEGGILQILEGETDKVLALFQKISLDERHSRIFTMLEFEIDQRNFEEWSMGFKQVSAENWGELGGYLDLKDKTTFLNTIESKTKEIITLVKSFVQVNLKYA